MPYAQKLKAALEGENHGTELITAENRVKKGDILFILSWENIIKKEILARHEHNIVIHASALPKGRGWSPLTWQILEGKNKIPVSLFEAGDKADSGPIYLQETFTLAGYELLDEMREKLGQKIIALALKFVKNCRTIKPKAQKGKPTFYPKRGPEHSEVGVKTPLAKIFNQFRAADNERYPVFFKHKGHKYILKIYKAE
ncbi:MAG: formyltransferase family protein [Patescibacteria group bacterium]